MKLSQISLRWQVISVIALAGILLTSIIAFVLAGDQRQLYYSQFASDLDVVSQSIAFDLELESNNLGRDISALMVDPSVAGIERATNNGGVDTIINVTTEQWKQLLITNFKSLGEKKPEYSRFRYIGAADNGRELVRINRIGSELVVVPEDELQEFGGSKFFAEVREAEKGSLHYSAVNLARTNRVIDIPHSPTIRVGAPVITPTGDFFGTLVINWDIRSALSNFESELRAQTGVSEINLYVLNRQGEYLYQPDPDRTFGFEFDESYRFQDDFSDFRTVLGEETTIGQLSENSSTNLFSASLGERRVYAQARVVSINPLDESRDLFVIATLDQSVLDAPVIATVLGFWGSATMIGFAALFVLIWLLSHQLSPLAEVTESAKAIAEGDYESSLPNAKSTEVGGLVNALAHMRSQISQREKELRDHRDTLELTVSKRTKELERARDEANRQAKFKGEFLANMSHEIRTPMTAILGLVDVLRHTEMSSKQQQYVHQIHNSSRALLRIINDILDISKIEAGKIDIELTDFSLLDTLEHAADLFASSAALKSIELHLSMDPNVRNLLIGDRTRLSQVLHNLLGNAVKFTESGEVVLKSEVLETSTDTVKIRFKVSDTGIGISTEAQKRLFKAFEQADTATTRTFGGTGLGLAISLKLIELMGGNLQVKSELGQGSDFWFDLEFKISSKPEHKLRSVQNFGKKVLVINAHPVGSEILTEMLQGWGCLVSLAQDPEQALESLTRSLASKTPFDFILLDNEIMERSSFKLVDEMERATAGAGISINPPILLMTEGELTKFESEKALPRNIKVAIKPLTVSRLLNVLEEMGQISIFEEKAPAGEIDKLQELLLKKLDERSTPVKVLLAEDNKTNQMVIQELFARYRIEFIIANNGKEALDTVQSQEVDLVLMDLQMPIMDGFEATEKIRKFKNEEDLPILSLSAATFTEDLTNAALAGMNDHLSKPINIEKMLAALLKWLPFNKN